MYATVSILMRTFNFDRPHMLKKTNLNNRKAVSTTNRSLMNKHRAHVYIRFRESLDNLPTQNTIYFSDVSLMHFNTEVINS